MKTDYPASGSSSGATSETKPTSTEKPAAELTEAEFLARQAQDAQAAIGKAWQDMKARLGQGVDPKAWAKEHPWIAVGTAVVAGFVATAALVPSKEEQALKKLAAIERALTPPPPPERSSNGDGKHEKGGIMGTILHEALGLLRPVLASVMAANMGAATVPPPDPQGQAGPVSPEEQGGTGV